MHTRGSLYCLVQIKHTHTHTQLSLRRSFARSLARFPATHLATKAPQQCAGQLQLVSEHQFPGRQQLTLAGGETAVAFWRFPARVCVVCNRYADCRAPSAVCV